VTPKGASLLDRYFYFFMSLLIVVVVVSGFSRTVGRNLIHPAVPPPFILYVHAAVFSVWVVFLILQSVLVRTSNVPLHRLIGWFGVTLGAAIPAVGFPTAITMGRFNLAHSVSDYSAEQLLIPFSDMIMFTVCFALAVYWRKKPEFHRRLILMATCALTAAAFGRFPSGLQPLPLMFYTGVDLLIVLGVARDLVLNRRVHRVYLYGLPAFIIGQTIAMYTVLHKLPGWLKVANAVLQ